MSAPKKILIVEDQRLIAADLELTLRNLGYAVAGSVAAGEEALAAALSAGPDLVLMDVRLAGALDGVDAARQLRAQLDVPVVFLTAYADETTVARVKEVGPFGYLVKPFNERELRAAIEIALYRHAAEHALARERARRLAAEEIKQLVEVVSDFAILLLDPAGNVVTWNVGAERLYGYCPSEIVGCSCDRFFAGDQGGAALARERLLRAETEGRAEFEGWQVRKEGARFWATSVLTAVRTPRRELRGFAVVTRDLTERKRRQDELAFLLEATTALAESLDLERTLDSVARLSVPRLADRCEIALVIDGKVRPVGPMADGAALEPGALKAVETGQTQRVDTDGDGRRHGRWVSVPMKGRGGAVCGVASFAYRRGARRSHGDDVSLLEDFAGRCGMAVENARLYQQAQQAIRARDEFLQVASHELRTPLTPLQLQLDRIDCALRKLAVDDPKLLASVEVARRQTQRLGRLVSQLLDVSRLAGGQMKLELREVDLCELARDAVAGLEAEAARVGSRIDVEVSGRVTGRWDRERVEQVVTNLVSNAIKYGAGKPIVVSVQQRSGVAQLQVADHGIGIAAEALGRIFGRFERAVSSRNYGGLGLGLFIAREIAMAHGGELLVRSQLAAGSTFTLMLPLQPGVQPGTAQHLDGAQSKETRTPAY